MPEDLSQVDPIVWIVIAVVAVVLIGVLLVLAQRKRSRAAGYEDRYGREYQRTIDRVGSREAAQRELDERAERRRRSPLRPLPSSRRDELLDRWERLQAQFIEAPAATVRNADVLLDEAARDRGYADADIDQRLQDLALEHSDEVHAYRQATGRTKADRGPVEDEESLRRTMVAGRDLFHALVLAGRGGDDRRTEGGPDRRDADRGTDRSEAGRSDHDGADGRGNAGSEREATDRPVAARPPAAEQRPVADRPVADRPLQEQPPAAEQRTVPPTSPPPPPER